MKKTHLAHHFGTKRILSTLLALALLCALVPAQAAMVMDSEDVAAVETPSDEEVAELEVEPGDDPVLWDVPTVAEPEPEEPMIEADAEEPAELLATYSGSCGDNLTWTLDTTTGVLSISGAGPMTVYSSYTIPWADYRNIITSVTIGEGVTSIGDYAFYRCTSLTSVTIPDSVTSIGDYAFYRCTSLTSVTIPDSVTSIGEYYTFGHCTSLTAITVDPANTAYSSEDGVLFNKKKTTLIQCPGGKAGAYTIPASVISLESRAFEGCADLTGVTIGEGVTWIPSSTFEGCTSLTSVTIPDRATNIWHSAFSGCTSLTSVTIGKGVTDIGDSAFSGCTSLTNVTIPDNVTNILDSAFSDCTSLTGVTIGKGVTSIGSYVFSGCTGLTAITVDPANATYGSDDGVLFNKDKAELILCPLGKAGACTIPASVTSINGSAFSGCTGLTSVTIGKGVTSIEQGAFKYCTGLTTITVDPANATYSSDDGVLFNKDKTELILCLLGKAGAYTIPASVTSIGDAAFKGCTSLTSVTIGDGVTSIGSGAFEGCTSLTSVTIGDGVTSIGDYAFYRCTSLTSVTIPNSVTSIGDGAFDSCTNLTSVTIPDSVTSIGLSAFWGCTSLTNVTIPASVTSIGWSAFEGCTSLTSVTIGDGVTSIGNGAFWGCTSLTSVTIPASVTSIGWSAFEGCTSLTAITVDPANTAYSSEDGVLFNKDKTELIRYPGSKAGAYTIPASVTSIKNDAFRNCTNLTNVTIPDSVTSIGSEAFQGCTSLTSVTIGDGVTSIGTLAFSFCASLTTVTIPDSVTSIGWSAFLRCTSLTNVTIPDSVTSIEEGMFMGCTSLTSVTIGNAVTSIEKEVFEGCTSLTSVTISDSVTSISVRAFYDCVFLSDIYYGGSVTEWNAITVAGNNDPLTTASIHYNCKSHTITFDPNGGTVEPSSKTVSNNMPYGMLPVPSRNGYVFDGWYTAITGGQLVQGADTVNLTGDQTLYAHWTSQFSYLPVVTTNEATNIGTKSATLSGTVQDDGGSEIASRQIVYWSKDNTAKRYTENVGQAFSKTLTDLTPATTYFFYAKAMNSSGEGTGDVRSFTTGQEPKPTSISVSPTYLSLDSGDTYRLAATVLPATAQDRSVVWASSNRSVATVDGSGNVTAVNSGEATITVTTAANGLTASCKVKVAAQADIAGSFDFSEWHMASAASNLNATGGFDWDVNYGGNFMMSTAYLARWGGAVLEKNDPYRAYGDGVYNSALSSDYHVQEVIWLPARSGSNDNAEFKAAVMNYGAAYVSFQVNWDYFTRSRTNYYFPNDGTKRNGGHAVAVVGWDDNYPASNFTVTPPGNGAFICKNSWGEYSGEDGYFYISYYDKYFGATGGAVFPKIETNSNYNTIYQYDPLGACSYLTYNDGKFYAANVFPQMGNTLRQSEKLRAVSFYTQRKNTSYEVYVITNYQNKASLYAGGTAVASGTFQEMGYHTVNLDAPITLAAGTRFAVIVKLSVADGAAAMYYEYPYANYSSKARANADESYYSSNGISWSDLTSFVKNANFCIKAFTDNGQASYSARLFEAIDSGTRTYESDRVYSLDDALQAGIPVNSDFIKWVKEQEMEEEAAVLAAAESEPFLGAIPSLTTVSGNSISFVAGTYLPTRYDLREENCVTAVRDQGNWGTCWTFASYASLESCLLKKTKSVSASFNAGNALDTLAGITQGGTSTVGDASIDSVQLVDGTLSAVIDLADGFNGAVAYLASYSQGSMTDIQQAALAPGRQSVSFPVSKDADSVKLFVLSSDSAPLCEAYQLVP